MEIALPTSACFFLLSSIFVRVRSFFLEVYAEIASFNYWIIVRRITTRFGVLKILFMVVGTLKIEKIVS